MVQKQYCPECVEATKVEGTETIGISLLGKDGCLMCCTALEDDVPFECYVTQISS